jgi:ABC-type transport system substrate-binding protein
MLIAEAGYPGGVHKITGRNLKIRFLTSADDELYLGWLISQFARIGIELQPDQVDWGEFMERLEKGNFQMLLYGWNADFPDPENFLFLFYGPNARTQGGENTANYRSDEYDELYEQIRAMSPGKERTALIEKAIAHLRHDAPWIWGTHPMVVQVCQPWLRNYKQMVIGANSLKYLRVDAALRTKLLREWNPGEVQDAKGIGGAAGKLRQRRSGDSD